MTSTAWQTAVTVLQEATPPDVQGAVQGLASSGGAVASIVGLLLGGVLYFAGMLIMLYNSLKTIAGASDPAWGPILP